MEGQNATVSPGTWRNLETYCLIVCREVLLSHDIPVEASNLKSLYDFVVQSNKIKAMSLAITITNYCTNYCKNITPETVS